MEGGAEFVGGIRNGFAKSFRGRRFWDRCGCGDGSKQVRERESEAGNGNGAMRHELEDSRATSSWTKRQILSSWSEQYR